MVQDQVKFFASLYLCNCMGVIKIYCIYVLVYVFFFLYAIAESYSYKYTHVAAYRLTSGMWNGKRKTSFFL